MENKWLFVEDCVFDVEINIFRAIEPVNAVFSRNKVILDTSPGGFRFEINCNYPGAYLDGVIIFDGNNITMSGQGQGFL